MTSTAPGAYAGDIDAARAWEELSASPAATLIDVRTVPEWSYVGVPSLRPLGKEPVLIEWQSFPDMTVADDFCERLGAELAARGVGRDAPLFFLCRSGARSRSAAIAMTGAGFTRCYNVEAGFEGPLDPSRHRGAVAGWKAAGLPWFQT